MTERHMSVRRLTESAILIALGFVLSYIQVKAWPQGGGITCFSMLPILLIGFRHGLWWGLGSGLVYSVLQLLQNHALVPPADGLGTYFAMVALDYVLAFGVLGLSALFRKKKYGLVYASLVCLTHCIRRFAVGKLRLGWLVCFPVLCRLQRHLHGAGNHPDHFGSLLYDALPAGALYRPIEIGTSPS